jgi:hypothetical protein
MPVATLELLRRYAVPEDIIRDLESCSFAAWLPIGPLRLVPMPELEDQTSGVRKCFENGYVVLAGCRNFDPVALDVRTRRMVYVSHELLWDDARKQFADWVSPTPFRYDEFWWETKSRLQLRR